MRVNNNINCVYVHRNSFTKEVFYIGIGNSKRPYDIVGRSVYWKRYVAKYGRTVHVLFEGLSWEESCQIEKYLIAYYGRRDIGIGPLVNRCDGGEGAFGQIGPWKGKKRPQLSIINKDKSIVRKDRTGSKHTDKSKSKMREKKIGFIPWNKGTVGVQPKWTEEQRNKFISTRTGNKHSDETKKKMSDSAKGKPKSEAHKAKLRGRIFTEEHRKNISKVRKGRKLSDNHKQKIRIASLIAWAKIKAEKQL